VESVYSVEPEDSHLSQVREGWEYAESDKHWEWRVLHYFVILEYLDWEHLDPWDFQVALDYLHWADYEQ
jgi:hypothetical protein